MKHAQAITAYTQAPASDADYSPAYYNLGLVLERSGDASASCGNENDAPDKYQRAVGYYHILRLKDSNSISAYHNLALVLLQAGSILCGSGGPEEALASFQHVIDEVQWL